MKFDLFAAMKIINYNFGNDTELSIKNFDFTYEITIRVLPLEFVPHMMRKNREWYSYKFYVTEKEVHSDEYCKLFNQKFHDAIETIKGYIEEAKI